MFNFDPLYLVYGGLALFPAIIWISFLFKRKEAKKIQLLIFLLGSLSVIPIFLIQYLFQTFPNFDIITVADQHISNPFLHFLLIYAWVGLTEELIKQWLIRYLDSKYLLIQSINDSIHFSLVAALGFSFAENIFYFYQIGTQLGLAPLLVAYLFRSIFTTCGHLIFSGFFGYYYGVAKFSISIFEQANLQGRKPILSRLIGRFLNISQIQAFQETTILKGLLLAIILHTFFNFTLEMNSYTGTPIFIAISALFIAICYLILLKLLKNRAGQLILVQGESDQQISTMAKTDEDVVIELLGMWFNKNKFVEVLHICERLLKRDPDNKIVKLFKAQAMDKMEGKHPYKTILSKIFPDQEK
jgi:RsiW-degrading membrane proteinase PrsW (M82 family)